MAKINSARAILLSIWIVLSAIICNSAEGTWIEVKSPNFIIISDGTSKQARQTARTFEQFRQLLQTVWPKLKIDPPTPLTIFAGKDQKSYKALLAEEKQERGATQSAGIFISGPERQLVALYIDIPGDRPYHVIYHEYIHMIMHQNFGELPLWLSEGLAELFANADLFEKSQGLGKFSPESAQILKTRTKIPLSVLMSATHDSPYYRQQEKAELFYAQCWALTHYLYLADKQAHQKQLVRYIDLLTNGVAEKDAESQAFGDLNALEQALDNYLEGNTYFLAAKAHLTVEEGQYETRTLSPAESLAPGASCSSTPINWIGQKLNWRKHSSWTRGAHEPTRGWVISLCGKRTRTRPQYIL
jgi:hypothetical protein